MRHVVVESIEACAGQDAVDTQWYSSSPAVVLELEKRGWPVGHLDALVDKAESDRLGAACYEAALAFTSALDASCGWKRHADLRLIFTRVFAQTLFVICRKAMALQGVLDAALPHGESVACVGREVEDDGGAQVQWGRVDTLYAALAARAGIDGLSVSELAAGRGLSAAVERKFAGKRLGWSLKIANALCNTPSSLFAKAWRLSARRLGRPRSVRLLPRARKAFFVHKDCELLDEALLGMVLRGGRVARLGKLPELALPGPPRDCEGFAALADQFAALAAESLRAAGVGQRPLLDTAVVLGAERVAAHLVAFRESLDGLCAAFDELLAPVGQADCIVTNNFSSTVERFLSCHCRERGTTVVAFEHGITVGLSEWSRHMEPYAGIGAAQVGVYLNRASMQATEPFFPGQERILAGLPRATSRMALGRVQRALARRALGLGRDEHVVCFVANLERNNFIYGPHAEDDLEFVETTKAVIRTLCRDYSGSTVVLKLYPAQRYIDGYAFEDLARKHPNLRIVRDMDFRFVRAAMDMIFLASTQSTLGWAMGAGVPVMLLETRNCPARVRGVVLSEDFAGQGRLLLVDPVEDLTRAADFSALYKRLFSGRAQA